jgi:hypothetical protein
MDWKSVVGHEGLYEVSDAGDVRSLPRPHARGRVLKQMTDPKGYRRVSLSKDGYARPRLVHHLVLEAFVGPRPAGQQCLHGDDDPAHNHVSNLRWGTARQNAYDKVANGRHHEALKTHCAQGHPFDAENTHFTKSQRRCRTCENTWQRNRRAARRLLNT